MCGNSSQIASLKLLPLPETLKPQTPEERDPLHAARGLNPVALLAVYTKAAYSSHNPPKASEINDKSCLRRQEELRVSEGGAELGPCEGLSLNLSEVLRRCVWGTEGVSAKTSFFVIVQDVGFRHWEDFF